MKKTLLIISLSLFIISCGGSGSKPVEATYNDTPGVDYSITLPPLVDTNNLSHKDTLHISDTLKVVE